MRRGRPPYPDVLTPREQEVLTLIREGLTNDQIAARLGISESGARYHVSEILSKLGVASRHEAAQWAGVKQRRWPSWLVPPHFSPILFAGTAIATAAIGFVALAIGVLIMDARGDDSSNNGTLAPNALPFAISPTATPNPDVDSLTSQIINEARTVYYFSRIALSDPARCQCDPVEHAIERFGPSPGTSCKSVMPETYMHPHFVPSIHADLTNVVLEACQILDGATSATLASDATRIASLLEPILIADDARIAALNAARPAPSSTPIPRPSALPLGVHPPDQRTGVDPVDHTIGLILANQWDQLAGEANFVEVECTFLFSPGLLSCGVGEPEGTKHAVFGVGSCSPGHLSDRGKLPQFLAFALSDKFLYAAFQMSLPNPSEREYLLLWRDRTNSNDRQVYLDSEGHITASYQCGTVDGLPSPNATTILPRPS